jgi:hypothetical protein
MDLVDACGASVKSDAVASDAELRAATPRAVLRRQDSVGKRVAASKTKHTYSFAIGSRLHEVIVDLSKWSGKRTLTVDGERVQGFKRSHSVTLPGAHTLDVRVESKYLGVRPALYVDGTKFKRLPLHRGRRASEPPPSRAPEPLAITEGRLLASVQRRAAIASIVPETLRERTLSVIHQASEDGYDLERALQKFSDGRTPCVVVVEAHDQVFGCFLGRVPTVNGRRRIDVGLFCGERAFPLVARPDAGFINCKRTQSYLAVGLDAATGGAAFRIDADLAAGWSDASAPFGSPRLHGLEEGDFSVDDVEVYSLKPLW